MIKFAINSRCLIFLLLCVAGIFASCEVFDKNAHEALEVSLKRTQVDYKRGQQFVSVKCSGNWKLSLLSDGEEVDWASLDVHSGRGDKENVRLTYLVNDTGHSRDLRIVLDNGSDWADCSLLQLAEGEEVDDGPVVAENADPRKHQWMELPEMNDPALGYYYHTFTMDDGKTYRNFSFGWSQKDRIALWVAYPLCRFYTNGSVGRTEDWELDPLLGKNSSAPFGGYGGKYARGHQLPSADRQCSYEANAQTFYGTNMTPQLNEHNGGIWGTLENKVRNIANTSDTTYVVTGVVVSSSSLTETDSYGESVTVPDAYFKVLLCYNKNSTIGQWNAAAFYLEHKNYGSEKLGKQHSMSVDKLEEMTGMDFFANLPAKVGEAQAAKIESADPSGVSLWW